jgi:uncharacterized repeat protein (TIGR03803 family)
MIRRFDLQSAAENLPQTGARRAAFWSMLSLLVAMLAAFAQPSSAQTNTTTLYSFTGGSSGGATPYGGLIQASDGNFYGMTSAGGSSSDGTVFKLTTSGTFTLLHSFAGGSSDGAAPYGSLVQASDGNLYGMTHSGGPSGDGTVFKITTSGTLTVLHTFFNSSTDGAGPYGSLIQASDGNLYGMTYAGGSSGRGTVFKITTSGTLTLLYSFSGSGTDGANPYGSLIQASDGNLYGMTYVGGSGDGTVFKLTTSGTFTLLHSFSSADGLYPVGSLVQASDGNLYGMTPASSSGNGTVFKSTTSGTFTLLHTFAGSPSDGAYPYGDLMQASDGNLYGMTKQGGSTTSPGLGAIFQVTTSGTVQVLSSLNSTSGDNPQYGALVQASDGCLYGLASAGGSSSDGSVLKLALNEVITLSEPLYRDGSQLGNRYGDPQQRRSLGRYRGHAYRPDEFDYVPNFHYHHQRQYHWHVHYQHVTQHLQHHHHCGGRNGQYRDGHGWPDG